MCTRRGVYSTPCGVGVRHVAYVVRWKRSCVRDVAYILRLVAYGVRLIVQYYTVEPFMCTQRGVYTTPYGVWCTSNLYKVRLLVLL